VSADVSIEHPVHRLRRDRLAHRPQGLMGAASGAKAIGAIEEVGLVNGIHDLGHRTLDDLVFQREDAERSLSAIRLWDVRPANWQRPIAAAVEPIAEIAGFASRSPA